MDETPGATLGRLVNGYQVTQAIHVAAKLGIADLLADGPRRRRPRPASGAHPDALFRLLRALAGVGVVREEAGRRFALTDSAPAALRRAGSLAGWARLRRLALLPRGLGPLEHGVRTGENAFRHVHGTDVWPSGRATRELSAFDLAMDSLRRARWPLLAAYDFGRFGTVVDVGGGTAPSWRRSLPGTRRRAASSSISPTSSPRPAVLAAAGVADRCEVVGGSFFEVVPAGGTPTPSSRSSTTGRTRTVRILEHLPAGDDRRRGAAGGRARARPAQRAPRREVLRPQHAGRAAGGSARPRNTPPW